MIIILYSFAILFLLLFVSVKKFRNNLIYFVLPLNVLADYLIVYFPQGTVHIGYVRGVIIGVILILYLKYIRLGKTSLWIGLFLSYLLVMVFDSSNLARSLNTYVKVFFAFSLFLICKNYISNYDKFRKFNLAIIATLIIQVLLFINSQIFSLGERVYSETSFYLGGSDVYMTYIFAYSIILLPLTKEFIHSRIINKLSNIFYLISAIIIILVFRRSAILALILGLFVFFVVGKGLAKKRVVKIGVGIIIVLFMAIPFYSELLFGLFEQRVVMGLETELESKGGRLQEIILVYSDLSNDPVQAIFGKELFNSVEYFDWFWVSGRPLHIDFMVLLHGAGIVGLFLFLAIYIRISLEQRKIYRLLYPSRSNNLLNASFWALFVASLVFSSANQIWALSPYSFFLMSLGSILGYESSKNSSKRKR